MEIQKEDLEKYSDFFDKLTALSGLGDKSFYKALIKKCKVHENTIIDAIDAGILESNGDEFVMTRKLNDHWLGTIFSIKKGREKMESKIKQDAESIEVKKELLKNVQNEIAQIVKNIVEEKIQINMPKMSTKKRKFNVKFGKKIIFTVEEI